MTGLMCEGFEITKSVTELAARFTNVVSSGLTFDAGRVAGTSIKADHTALQTWRSRSLGSSSNNVIIGTAFKATRVADNTAILMIIDVGGNVHVSFEVLENSVSDFVIKCYRSAGGGKVLLGTTTAITYNSWHYLEFKVSIHDTSGSITVRADEVNIFASGAVLDTRNAGVQGFDKVAWSMQARSSGEFCWMDDGYVLDGLGTVNNNFLGDQITEGRLPVSDGDVSDMTPSAGTSHFAMVDDASEGDGDTTYLSAVANEKKELFGMTPLASIADNVSFVQHRLTTRLTVAGSRNVKFTYRDAANVDADSAAQAVALTTYDIKELVQEVQPVSLAPWTLADLSEQFGFKTVA